MKFYMMPRRQFWPQIDLLSGKKGVVQGDIPDVSRYLTANSRVADAYLVPHDLGYLDRNYLSSIELYALEKPVFIFNMGDFPKKCKLGNVYLFQNFTTKRNSEKIIILPYNISMPRKLQVREKQLRPTISFVGYLPKMTIGRVSKTLMQMPMNPIMANPVLIRRSGIAQISKSEFPKTLIVRSFYGGARSLTNDYAIIRQEYVDSLLSSDVIFSPRGDGNNSQRFYESLAMGRIPMIPDSKIKLPCIPFSRLRTNQVITRTLSFDLGLKLETYWKGLSNHDYEDAQQQNFDIYWNELKYDVFIDRLFKLELKQFFELYIGKSYDLVDL